MHHHNHQKRNHSRQVDAGLFEAPPTPPPVGIETDPVFAGSEAALLVAGDKAKIDMLPVATPTIEAVLNAGNDANGKQLLKLSFLRVGDSDNSVATEVDTGDGSHIQLQGQGRTLVLATDNSTRHAASLECSGGGQPFYIVCGNGIVFEGAPRMISLPVADPHVTGQLWNDGGALKVSAG